MTADRPVGGAALAALVAAGLAVCCGLPVLVSLGAGIAIAGVGVRSWLLAIAGLVVVAIAVVRVGRHRTAKVARPADEQEGMTNADRSRTR